MTADNDVNSIFEKHAINEIENLLSKMRRDIEKKKEDLRIMVGERYRDLIEAADTISDMRESAEAICKNIQTMEGLCESLQQRGLIGFKTRMSPSVDNSRLHSSSHQYSLAIQVKLLVDVPEILWGLTEKKEYLDASQLFLLSQQAHTALQLSPNANEMLNKFPVISRQWSSISQFRSTITKGCVSLIKNEVKNWKLVMNAVAAMMFLEGNDMKQSLKKVLSHRKSSLTSSLSLRPSTIAKTQLVNFVAFFISSFNVVNDVFVAPKKGEMCCLEKKIREISGEKCSDIGSSEPPISLLYESSLGLSFLPKSVVEFRPKLRCKVETLAEDYIQEEMQHWLESIVSEASGSVSQLLSCITSIKALALIRSSIWKTQTAEMEEDDWKKMIFSLLGKSSFTPWKSIVQGESLNRAQHLVKKELNNTKNNVVQMVKDLTTEITTNSKVCSEEGDVTDFLWSESTSDLPDQSAWASLASRNTIGGGEKMGLFYKSRGFTKKIQGICKAVNSKLVLILEDVSYYAPNFLRENPSAEGPDGGCSETESALQDYNILLRFLEEETVIVFKGFLDELEAVAMEHSKFQEGMFGDLLDGRDAFLPIPEATVIVTISRLCQALPIVCQQLKICAGASLLGNEMTAKRVSLGMQPETKAWLDLSQCFGEKSAFLMSKFLSLLTRLFGSLLKKEIVACVQGNEAESFLLLFPMWERVRIKEESEGGSVVESSISIPAHPSPSLSKALMKICSAANSVCAHTISRSSQMELVTSLCSELTSVYEIVDASVKDLNQTVSLQLIFDLKLIHNILLSRENKELNARISTLIHKLEFRVDPFDLDVFSPHLNTRVKMAAQRLLVLLGTIIPREKQPLTVRGMTSSSGNNTLTIVPSVEIPRFSNVPLPPSATPTRKTSLLLPNPLESHFKFRCPLASSSRGYRKTNRKRMPVDIKTVVEINSIGGSHDVSAVTSTHDLAPTVLSSSRSAASFFSAMSSSWFGGTSQ